MTCAPIDIDETVTWLSVKVASTADAITRLVDTELLMVVAEWPPGTASMLTAFADVEATPADIG